MHCVCFRGRLLGMGCVWSVVGESLAQASASALFVQGPEDAMGFEEDSMDCENVEIM